MALDITQFTVPAMIAGVIITPLVLRSRERLRLLNTLRELGDRSLPPSADVIATLMNGPPSTPQRDFRRGCFLIAAALAFIVFGVALYLIISNTDPHTNATPALAVCALAALPGFVGVAYLMLSRRKVASDGG